MLEFRYTGDQTGRMIGKIGMKSREAGRGNEGGNESNFKNGTFTKSVCNLLKKLYKYEIIILLYK